MIPITTIALFRKFQVFDHIETTTDMIPDAHRGFGLHFWDVPADNIVLLRKVRRTIPLFVLTWSVC